MIKVVVIVMIALVFGRGASKRSDQGPITGKRGWAKPGETHKPGCATTAYNRSNAMLWYGGTYTTKHIESSHISSYA